MKKHEQKHELARHSNVSKALSDAQKSPEFQQAMARGLSTDPIMLEQRRCDLESRLTGMRFLMDGAIDPSTPPEQKREYMETANIMGMLASLEAQTLMIDCLVRRKPVKIKMKSGRTERGTKLVPISDSLEDIRKDTGFGVLAAEVAAEQIHDIGIKKDKDMFAGKRIDDNGVPRHADDKFAEYFSEDSAEEEVVNEGEAMTVEEESEKRKPKAPTSITEAVRGRK